MGLLCPDKLFWVLLVKTTKNDSSNSWHLHYRCLHLGRWLLLMVTKVQPAGNVKWSESGTFAASVRRALVTVSVTQGHKDGVAAIPSKLNADYFQLHSTWCQRLLASHSVCKLISQLLFRYHPSNYCFPPTPKDCVAWHPLRSNCHLINISHQ